MTDTGDAARRMEISDVERKSDRLHRATTPERASQTPRRVGLSPPPTSARARRARVVRFRSHSTRPLSFARARSSDHDVAIHRVASKRRRRRRRPRRLGSCPRRARGVPASRARARREARARFTRVRARGVRRRALGRQDQRPRRRRRRPRTLPGVAPGAEPHVRGALLLARERRHRRRRDVDRGGRQGDGPRRRRRLLQGEEHR